MCSNQCEKGRSFAIQEKFMKYAKQDRQYDVNNSLPASFLHNSYCWTRVRKLCVTENGLIGWVPIEAREGDAICVFEGAKVPYMLRKTAEDDAYIIIGHCFLHGILFGEAMTSNEIRSEDIILR